MLCLIRKNKTAVHIGTPPNHTVVRVEEIGPHSIRIHVAAPFSSAVGAEIGLRVPFPVGPAITVKLLEVLDSETVRLGVEAPREILVNRDDR